MKEELKKKQQEIKVNEIQTNIKTAYLCIRSYLMHRFRHFNRHRDCFAHDEANEMRKDEERARHAL